MIKQFVKFALVGIVNTLTNLTILYILTDFFGIYYMVSAVFGFLVAVTNSFIMNSFWTFKETSGVNRRKECSRFFVVSISALIVNLSFLYIFTEFFGIYYLLSQILAVGVATIVSFSGNKFWTFK